MAEREALRDFQRRLADRLQAAPTLAVQAAWLAVEVAGSRYLIPLAQAGEIFPAAPALTVPHSQPILSTSTGHFAAIWADDANSFDVAWSDQSFDRQLATYTDVEPAADAVLSSAARRSGSSIERFCTRVIMPLQ
jgi:hypothetical protein